MVSGLDLLWVVLAAYTSFTLLYKALRSVRVDFGSQAIFLQSLAQAVG